MPNDRIWILGGSTTRTRRSKNAASRRPPSERSAGPSPTPSAPSPSARCSLPSLRRSTLTSFVRSNQVIPPHLREQRRNRRPVHACSCVLGCSLDLEKTAANGSIVIKCVLKILACVVYVIQKCAEYLTAYAYVYIGIHGYNFMTASCASMPTCLLLHVQPNSLTFALRTSIVRPLSCMCMCACACLYPHTHRQSLQSL